jgi:CDP-diacylglycerol---serine O-phosphatidyltransferase
MNKSIVLMFNLPNLITSANMLCGVFSILLSLSGRIDLAPYPIFLGAILDFLDGFAARMLKIQSEMGKQLDSLADMITFGLAPGIMMMMILILVGFDQKIENIDFHSFDNFFESVFNVVKSSNNDLIFFSWFQSILRLEWHHFLPFIALLIPFFSLFRLAKFNIDTRQTDSFIGLPTPANTIFFCMFPLVMTQVESIDNQLFDFIFKPLVLSTIILVMSILLVSEIPLFSLKFKHFKWEGNQLRYVFLITCSLLIVSTWFWSLGLIVILYLILSVIENLFLKKKHEI